ncbi:glycosyltransferase [Desulfohalobiaceae bacterium Ax17]|jgi:glycosyltransferase involved in cell wall biosynthesis|uniref:glycosyltransferase n=1 Tax=Desulfovulcanus ferrireducens TaxID=2831190 RepID=UPI00207BAAB4|nr:glycosyltransferase [Desulfovulcanus ferrireducens]MBT8763371.1 glycosyltransferase [Desulfovulcanus ferrireducens]
MKLLCIVPSYWPAFQFGGPIYSVHGLNKALVKKGVDVTVYTTNVGLNGKVPVNQEVDVDEVKITYFAFTKSFEFMGATGWQFTWQMTRALRNNLNKFDLVHIVAVWNYPITAAAHYCKRYKKPYLISPRGLLYPYTTGKKSWKKWPYYHLMIKKTLRCASAIHYTTEDEKELCHRFLGLNNQAVVVPNGLELLKFEALPPGDEFFNTYPHLSDKRLLLYLGRINWKKGLDILIEAFSYLVKNRKDAHLVLVGGDDGDGYKEKIERLVKKYGIEKYVTFTGILSGSKKLAAYRAVEIFILPSYSENFGMVVVEAMACGCPVIISNRVGIYREVQQREAGMVIEPEVSEIVKAVELLLDNKGLKERISANGYDLVKSQYDIDKVAEKMIGVYESM